MGKFGPSSDLHQEAWKSVPISQSLVWFFSTAFYVFFLSPPPTEHPDFNDSIILRRGATVEHVCHSVHRTLAAAVKYALVWVSRKSLSVSVRGRRGQCLPLSSVRSTQCLSVWLFVCLTDCAVVSDWLCARAGGRCSCSLVLGQGTSTKYSPQRVGLQHRMEDEDVIQIIKK